MKTPILILLATLSLSAFAQIQNEHPCAEFDQKLNAADAQVKDFDRELRKLDAKLNNIESRLSERTQALNNLLSQRESMSDSMRSLGSEQASLRQESQRLQNDSIGLRNTLSRKEIERQNHAAIASSTRDLAVKREHLRMTKLLEKEIAELQPQLGAIDQAINDNNVRIRRNDLQAQQLPQQIAEINRKIEQEQRDPAIARLQQDRAQVIDELSNAQITVNNLNDKLARANSHVNMCYGYLELSVKYPAALRVAKKLNKQGCNRYVQENHGSELENQAEDDVLASVCR